MVRVFGILVFAWGSSACSETAEPEPACLAPVDTECTPLFEPTFREIHARRFSVTCSSGGASCHGPNGRKAGLALADFDEAHELLLGNDGSRARVVPFEPECSELVRRLDDSGAGVMPPGEPLPEGERCAVRIWIENGALKE
jgi:hypothetical protein